MLPDEVAELNLVSISTAGQNFGWPYRTGTNVLLDGGPGGLIDPVLDYRPATPPATPSQPDDAFRPAIVGGAAGPEAIASLANRYVLATVRGEILTIDTALLAQGTTRSASDVERRTADFVPDVGTIDRIAAMAAGRDGTLFILDEDGELFRVDPG